MSLPAIERKAALALFPYFNQQHPRVFDVGCNVGDWAAILIENVQLMHLFEPNSDLRTYCKVRFRHLKNHVLYHAAISDKCSKWGEDVPFYYFEDKHDGLSNIINNKKWDYLNPLVKSVQTITLDSNIGDYGWVVDFVKLDIEGAEFLALQGAKNCLQKKLIKFIQIEKSEHYDFTPVPDYVRQFGYDIFHFDGNNFVKWTNQEAENLYIMDAHFTQDWNREFINNTQFLKGEVQFALEIGVFEGLTSRYICDELLDKSADARMIAVDPLTDEYLPGHPDNEMFKGQYSRFVRNTRTYPIELLRMTSDKAFKSQGFTDYRFDFIYIDGDHRQEAVYKDAVNSFAVCRPGGHILFDDYEWRDETKQGIDRFLREYDKFITVLVKGYQVLVRKENNNA